MRILLLNQTFFPDVASSAQHLTDLALGLAERGHQVTVVTSRRAYNDPRKLFQRRQTWRGIRICRVLNSGLGKQAKWRRASDFGTFMLSCCFRLALLPKPDVVVAMTSPPLISCIGALYARFRGSTLCYWVMDMNPDEAMAAGWLSPGSLAARCLERLSRFSFHQASAVIALDRFMQKRIADKGVQTEKTSVIPPWSHDSEITFDPEGRARFRRAHGLDGKCVVMYSGNHSPCHPLDTVLEVARKMAGNSDVAFCFIGGGSEFNRVKQFAQDHRLARVLCLSYQPISQLAASLSAADVHLVVMGQPFVGIVHPCKLYNVLCVGSPVIYIGPTPSHISEALGQIDGQARWRAAAHGQADLVIQYILEMKQSMSPTGRAQPAPLLEAFSKNTLLPKLIAVIEARRAPHGNGV